MFRLLVVFFILFTGASDSFARSFCASLFRDPLAVAEAVNKENNHYLTQDSLAYKISQASPTQQKKINKLLDRVKEGDVISDKDLSDLTEDLVALLYGPRDILDRYFFKAKDERAAESLRFQIRKQLLEQGFVSFLQDISPKQKLQLWLKLKQSVRRVSQSPVFNWAQIFWGSLPDRRPIPVSEELMTNVIWNGVDAHRVDIRYQFQRQSNVELYTVVKRISSAVLVGALTVHGFQNGLESQRAERDAKVDLAVQQLNYFSGNLASEVRDYKFQVRQQALEEAKATFLRELGRPPTESEIADMKRIIFK